jgi:hypothetical protein
MFICVLYIGKHMIETKNYTEATPEQVAEWEQTDFFRGGDFDVIQLLVIVPALIQIGCVLMMFSVFWLNSKLF